MLDIVFIIIKQLLEIITYVLIIWGILQCKLKKEKYVYFFGTSLFVIISGIIIIYDFFEYMDAFYVPVFIVFILFAFEEKLIRKVVYFFVAFINTTVINMLIVSLLDLIPGIDNRWLLDSIQGSVVYFTICVVFILLFIFIIRSRRQKIKDWVENVPLYYFVLMLIPILCCDLLMVFLQYREEFSKTDLNKLVTMSVIFLAFFLIGWSVIFISINASKKYHKIQDKLKTKYLEIQKENYEKILEKDYEIRKFRHDINAHMSCMQMYIKDNKFNELEKYISEVKGELDIISESNFKSGNDIADAILNHMQTVAQKEGIIIKLTGGFPFDLKISQFDLCTIFFNTIQNAIDATKKIRDEREKTIYVNLKIHKDILYIVVENPIDKTLKSMVSTEETSKKDKLNHGFGLGNIKNVVNKYSGDIKISSENNKFSIKILLYEIV